MDTGNFANGLAAVGFTLLLGMMIRAGYRRDPSPRDNNRPHSPDKKSAREHAAAGPLAHRRVCGYTPRPFRELFMRALQVAVALAASVLMFCELAAAQQAPVPQTITGRARAVQADQIAIDEQRISLYGIDAPDPDQDRECLAGRTFFGCYTSAKRKLEEFVDLGPVTCTDSGEKNFLNFPYMTCKIGGIDIGEDIVRQGWAVAFLPQTDKYKAVEAEAKAAKRGLWQDTLRFTIPWNWREINGRPVFGP